MSRMANKKDYKQISIYEILFNSIVEKQKNPQTQTSEVEKLNTGRGKKETGKKVQYTTDGVGALLTAILSPKPISIEQAIYMWENGSLKGFRLTDQDTEDMIKIRESHIRINANDEEIEDITSWREIGEMYGIGASAVLRRIEYYYRKKSEQQAVQVNSSKQEKLKTAI